MANLNITLYPPQIPTYQNAFVLTSKCRIYFSLSIYNSYKDIQNNAQVTVSNQNTNQSVLSLSKYPNEIKLCDVKIDNTKNSDKYYIEIEPSDLQNGFEINQYYKVQIRFTSSLAPTPPDSAAINKWLVDNIDYFSEWSTVCLIRAISQPILTLQNLSSSSAEEGSNIAISTNTLDIVGSLTFQDEQESDSLSSYQIKLYDEENNLLTDSGIIYTNAYNSPNEINYTLKYILENGSAYTVTIDIATNNYYYQTFTYNIIVIQTHENPLNALVTAENEKESGRIKITVASTTTDTFQGSVIIRRTSNRSNFTIWEDIYTRVYPSKELINFIWYDCTVESGIWYNYSVQKKDIAGSRGTETYIEKPVLAYFEDMFLNAEEQQLRIRYNPTVSTMRQNVSEARAETLGSQYPIIRRNGYINYRSLNISGLITFLDDFKDIFTNKSELYGEEAVPLYENYNEEERITEYNDYILEREFREKVITFLYKDNIKLLRTLTEGNVLVKLMNISLMPQTTLGRLIYSFSAEAYEVAECSLDNFVNYGIIITEEDNIIFEQEEEETVVRKEVLGQIQDTIPADTNIVQMVKEKYETDAVSVELIRDIKFSFYDDPYQIKEDALGNLLPLAATDDQSLSIGLGYIIYINGESIMVSEDGVYALMDLEEELTSITFPIDSSVSIDYIAVLAEERSIESEDQITSSVYYYNDIVGQVWGAFNYGESLYEYIEAKYAFNYDNYNQRLIYIGDVSIEANTNMVFYIQTDEESTPLRNVINETNVLTIQDKTLKIRNIYFGGLHLQKETNKNKELVNSNKYYQEDQKYNSLGAIGYPQDNHVYVVDNERYIWYNENWENINENDDVEIPTSGLIDYYCRIVREVYLLNE